MIGGLQSKEVKIFKGAVIVHYVRWWNDLFWRTSAVKGNWASLFDVPFIQQQRINNDDRKTRNLRPLHNATASCFSTSLLKIKLCVRNNDPLSQAYAVGTVKTKRRPISSRCISLGYRCRGGGEREYIPYIVCISQQKKKRNILESQGKTFCTSCFAKKNWYGWLCWF